MLRFEQIRCKLATFKRICRSFYVFAKILYGCYWLRFAHDQFQNFKLQNFVLRFVVIKLYSRIKSEFAQLNIFFYWCAFHSDVKLLWSKQGLFWLYWRRLIYCLLYHFMHIEYYFSTWLDWLQLVMQGGFNSNRLIWIAKHVFYIKDLRLVWHFSCTGLAPNWFFASIQ